MISKLRTIAFGGTGKLRTVLVVLLSVVGIMGLLYLYALGQHWAHGERISIRFENAMDREVVLIWTGEEWELDPGESVTIGFEDSEWEPGEPELVTAVDKETRQTVYSATLTREDVEAMKFRITFGNGR